VALNVSVSRIGLAIAPERDVGAIGDRIGYLLHLADIAHMRAIQDLLGDIGLTATRATALAYVRANPGCGQTELARALQINRASAMEVVNALALIGAVERRSGRDKRSNALFLTPIGDTLFAKFDEISIKVDEVVTSRMSPDDIRELTRLLVLVGDNAARHAKD